MRVGPRTFQNEGDCEDSVPLSHRFAYGLASSLLGAALCAVFLFMSGIPGSWQLMAIIMGVSFAGGFFIGSKFFEFAKELLHKMW